MQARSTRTSHPLSWFICWLLLASVGFAQDSRTWKSGGFSITGKFVSEKNGTVTLKDADGDEVEIALDKLSEADQKYVRDFAANPFKKKTDSNPFKKSMPRSGAGSATEAIDWTAVKALGMPLSSTEWNYKPDPSDFETKPFKISLAGKSDFFEKTSGFVGNVAAGRFAAGFHVDGRMNRGAGAKTRLVLADAKSSKVVARVTIDHPKSTERFPGRKPMPAPLAIHDDGKQLLVGNDGKIEVWVANGRNLEKVREFEPYPGSKNAVKAAWTLPNNQFATWNGEGKLAVWDFDSTTPIYTINTGNSGTPALSPNRNYMAFVTSASLGILDTQKAEIIAAVPTPRKLNWPTLKFSPSGKKLVCAAHTDILLWDMTTGQLERDTPGPNGVVIHGRIAFPHDNFLLLAGQHMIELENRLRMWEYSGMGTTVAMGKYTSILIPGKTESAILVGEIPHPQVFTELQKALTQPDLFVFRKGCDVKLDVSGVPAQQRSRVEKAIAAKLSEMKCTVNNNAPVTIVAKVSGPKSSTRSYMHSGDHKVTQYSTSLQIMYQQKVAWQKSATNIPYMLMLKSGENVSGKLAEASKGPAYGFYDRLKLPEFVQKPAEKNQRGNSRQSIGSSKVTPIGIQ